MPILALVLASGSALADPNQEYVLTLYGGYRDGGQFVDASNERDLSINSSATWALSLDMPLDQQRQVQVFLSHQSTDLAPPVGASQRLPLKVSYLHLGGTYFFDGPLGQGPYAVGGLGASLFQLEGSGYGNELRPSINLGVGYQWLLGSRAALRLEGRLYSSLINSSGGLFCSGGCVVSIRGDTVTQGEVQLGLGVRF